MAAIAFHVRPTLFGAVVLTAVAMAPWRDHRDPARDRVAALELPRTIVVESFVPANGSVVTPPAHPDAQPWPRGMVITPPPIDGAIVLWGGSPLDNLLSVLLAPLHALEPGPSAPLL